MRVTSVTADEAACGPCSMSSIEDEHGNIVLDHDGVREEVKRSEWSE